MQRRDASGLLVVVTESRRQLPIPEVRTTVQLGQKGITLMVRGLFGKCPICGSWKSFNKWFTMKERCPRCSFKFERIEGHWIGAIAANTVATMGLMLIILAVATAVAYPDSPPVPPFIALFLVLAILGPIVFFPSSRTLWSAIDLLMRPLKYGEVDPRYVVIDPPRDALAAESDKNQGAASANGQASNRASAEPQRAEAPEEDPTP